MLSRYAFLFVLNPSDIPARLLARHSEKLAVVSRAASFSANFSLLASLRSANALSLALLSSMDLLSASSRSA